jgi:type IV secretion system protein VirB4
MFDFFKKKNKTEFVIEDMDHECVPYACHYDDYNLLTKNGELIQAIKIEGYSKEITQFYNEDLRNVIRKAIMDNVTDRNIAIYFHTIRNKHNLDSVNYYSWTFARDTHDGWAKKNYWRDKFVNELYVTIIHEGKNPNTKKELALSLVPRVLKKHHMDKLAENAKNLHNIVDKMLDVLKAFGGKRLGVKHDHLGAHSEALEFLSKIICLRGKRVAMPIRSLDQIFCQTKVAFGGNVLEVLDEDEKHFSALFSIKEYHEFAAKALDKFLRISSEFVITQTLNFVGSNEAKKSFAHFDYILGVSKDETLREYSGLRATIESDRGKPTDYASQQMTVMIIGESLDALQVAVISAMKEARKLGIVMIREDLNIELCFWSQLPGNFHFFRRKSYINTNRSASFASLHNTPSVNTENIWGSALTLFRRENGAPHFFNLHVGNAGHTIVAGTTDSAKATLVNFILSESSKYNPSMFYIDQFPTSRVTIKALGGKHEIITLEGKKPSLALNPFSMQDSEKNRQFLKNWLLLLLFQEETFKQEQQKEISAAIDKLYAKSNRQISMLLEFINDEDLKSKLSIWCKPNKYGFLFDNAYDEISSNGAKVLGVDINNLMGKENIIVIAPFMSYCLYRYSQTLDNSPAIIIINDANELLKNEIFIDIIPLWLDELTKKNALCIFVCDVSNKIEMSITSFNNKIVTSLFLPDTKADKYKDELALNKNEIDSIKSMKLIYRHFMIKQNNELIIVELNLDGMDYAIKALGGKSDAVKAMDKAIAEFSDNPNRWIIPFYKNLFPELYKK